MILFLGPSDCGRPIIANCKTTWWTVTVRLGKAEIQKLLIFCSKVLLFNYFNAINGLVDNINLNLKNILPNKINFPNYLL